MLTFIPLYENGEPVVRPPKKGEWYRQGGVVRRMGEHEWTNCASQIYLAVDYSARLAAERVLVEVCQEADMLFAHGVGGTMCVSSNQDMRDNGNRNIEEARTILAKIKFALDAATAVGIGGEK